MLVDSFLDYLRYERNYSEATVITYRTDVLQFREFVQGTNASFNPSEIEPADVRSWIIALMEKGYAAGSVNRKLSSLRAFYKFLLRRGEVTKDPLLKVVAPKRKKPLPSFLKEKEMDRLLEDTDFGEGMEGCRDKLIIDVFYSTGMRLSELMGLNDGDVDLFQSQFRVTGKRNKQRLIPFGERLKGELQDYIKQRDLTLGMKPEAFFVNKKGARLRHGFIYKMVKRNLSKVATLKRRGPHTLRHTFATVMLNHHAELEAVKELLGHSSLAATEVYTHTTLEELKKVYKQAHPRA